jgi:hypothetical protein
LASLHSPAEENQLKSLLSPEIGYWIGANDRQVEGQWVWTDRTPMVYLRKINGEVSEEPWKFDCGALYGDEVMLQEEYCYEKKGFICKKQV